MAPLRILAVDPGGNTGWAAWEDGEVRWGQIPGGLLGAAGHLTDREGGVCTIPHPALTVVTDVVVIERYTIGERTVKFSRQSDALEITGHLRAMADAAPQKVVLQQPRDAMRMFTDERLKAFGWWARGEEHARDALRHLGLYLAKQRLVRLTDPTWRGEGDGGS